VWGDKGEKTSERRTREGCYREQTKPRLKMWGKKCSKKRGVRKDDKARKGANRRVVTNQQKSHRKVRAGDGKKPIGGEETRPC